MSNIESMKGWYPGVVKSYDQATRLCRVEIPGITDGGDVYPLAEILYPIGDKSRAGANSTEIEILPGDTVWIEFIGGDSRYPIITGYRNPQAGNSADWRRFHHANVELIADNEFRITVGASSIVVTPTGVTITADRIDLN